MYSVQKHEGNNVDTTWKKWATKMAKDLEDGSSKDRLKTGYYR